MGSSPALDGATLPDSTAETGQRRSSRRRVAPRQQTPVAEERDVSAKKKPADKSETRRNPKRKASEASVDDVTLPDDLLDEALKPLTPQDIEEWEGWVELESEPAFFSTILGDLGVQGVKAHELFSMDQVWLDELPKPVFGMIFLFQALPDHDGDGEEEKAADIWFANQTTSNACATVALLNIVMNAQGIELGDKLRDFKEKTRTLSTPLRGHYLSSNAFIRKIHNSFTRRMDHLNADLFLENEVSEAPKRRKKRETPRKGAKRRKTVQDTEYGYHFIAYVPAEGHVWELDGLKMNPQKIGPVGSGDWTTVAQSHIHARVLQYEEDQLAFSLLALCQSPLVSHSSAIATATASLRHLHAEVPSQPAFLEPPVLDFGNGPQLAEFQLKKSDIEDAEVPTSFKDKIADPSFGVDEARKEHEKLTRDLKVAMGEYRMEMMSIAGDELRVQGRKKDYAPALHKWVKTLAEKGVLENIIKDTRA